jgi:hypothetical protein
MCMYALSMVMKNIPMGITLCIICRFNNYCNCNRWSV